MDKPEICQILESDKEDGVYQRLSYDLMDIQNNESIGQCSLPFEATFQALYDVLGFPVIRFVEFLKGGLPNLHHRMIAYALKQGHTVITTNFDKKIEDAYTKCFNGEKPKVLIKDKEYQEAIDKELTNGVLAKIHGDLNDYNSLAPTLTGVTLSCDATIYLGDDIDSEKGKKQLRWIHPKTFLSIPKALFLQKVLKNKKIVVLGYSGSDVSDIMPILTAREFQCRGVWVEHTSKLPVTVEKWIKNAGDREFLKPDSEEEVQLNITSRVSRFFLDAWGDTETGIVEKIEPEGQNTSFKDWIDRLRLRPGDGLACIARLYLQRGNWARAEVFLEEAIKKYRENLAHNEWSWLVTKSNLSYVLNNRCQKDHALKVSMEVREYIEKARKQKLYPSLYAKTLIYIANKWINSPNDKKADEILKKAMKIAEEIEDKEIFCYGLRLAADRKLAKRRYEEALDGYLTVLQWASDFLGDPLVACLSSMGAALCYIRLGQQHKASRMLANAENFASFLGNENLIKEVERIYKIFIKTFQGKIFQDNSEETPMPYKKPYKDLYEEAKKQVDENVRKEFEEFEESRELISFELYDRCLDCIDKLLKKINKDKDKNNYNKIKAVLLFVRSNIYRRTGRRKEEIEILKQFCRIEKNYPFAEHNLGGAYSRLNNYDMAEKHFLKAIEIMNGNYPLAHCNLGILYTKMGRLEEAKQQLLKAEKSEAPEYPLNALRKRINLLKKTKRKK